MTPECPGCRERAQAAQLERALVHLEVARGSKQHHDLAGARLPPVDQLGHACSQHPGLGVSPGLGLRESGGERRREILVLVPAARIRQQQLDERLRARRRHIPVQRAAVPAAGEERRIAGESSTKGRVDHLEQLGSGPEVAGEREAPALLAQLVAALAKQAHIGVAEAIDGLQLVADRERVPAVQRPQDRELARIRVLELVDHQQLEARGPSGPQALALGEQRAREQLEIVEIHNASEPLEPVIGQPEAFEQIAEQRAGGGSVAVEILGIGRERRLRQARQALPAAAQLGVQRLDHPAYAVEAVGGDDVDRLGAAVDEACESLAEGELAQAPGESFITDRELRVKPGRERVAAKQARAEAVERSHQGGLRVACCLPIAELEQPRPDPGAQLAGGALGEGDREDPPRRDAILADGPHEPLHEHRGLAAPRGSGQRQRLRPAADRFLLLVRERDHEWVARVRERELAVCTCLLSAWASRRHQRSQRQIAGYMQPPRKAHVAGRAASLPRPAWSATSRAAACACSSSSRSCSCSRRSPCTQSIAMPASRSSAPRARRSSPASG